jgi:hypothetical protein
MVGRRVHVSFAEPATWFFTFDESADIRVECPWRLVHKDFIAVSSEDHRQQYGLPTPIDAAALATSLLTDSPIQKVELREGTADLMIEFCADLRVEIVPFSSGYESWHVHDPNGSTLIAQGGGHLSVWVGSQEMSP